jgi:hypothetical protein
MNEQDLINEIVCQLEFPLFSPRTIRSDYPSFVKSGRTLKIFMLTEDELDGEPEEYLTAIKILMNMHLKYHGVKVDNSTVTRKSPDYLCTINEMKNFGTIGITHVFVMDANICV